jgi:hypothetical protein
VDEDWLDSISRKKLIWETARCWANLRAATSDQGDPRFDALTVIEQDALFELTSEFFVSQDVAKLHLLQEHVARYYDFSDPS